MANSTTQIMDKKTSMTKNLSVFLSFFLLLSADFSNAKNTIRKKAEQIRQSPFSSWGINLTSNDKKDNPSINLIEALPLIKPRKKVTVAVIDTGINIHHPFLKNNVDYKGKKGNIKSFGVDFSNNKKVTSTPSDEHGHGTHVSGIIKSIFPEVRLMVLKYYNPKGSGQDNLNATIKALKYAVDQNVDIINYSGGGPEASAEERKILVEAERKGILVIAAAGNESSNIDLKSNAYFPASYNLSNIVTVAAYDQSLRLLSTSNYGKQAVDIAAPGFRIKSASTKSIYRSKNYAYMSGTSQATAFVTGVAAIIKSQYSHLSHQDIKKIVLSSAEFRKQFSGKVATGGKLNAYRALKLADQYSKANGSKQKSRTLAKFKEQRFQGKRPRSTQRIRN
jgi:subtilisin family serine protease